ncbi:MAG: Maf family protein [Oscillospiraceae bacterium]|nr:Maf family protein [Oscillospiraceae bacterium]
MNIILASASPRRRELLTQMGVSFTVQAADVDETMDKSLPPEQAVARISARKASAIACAPDDVVIAADTIVCIDGQMLGKPQTPEQAMDMLGRLQGRAHTVMTGLTVRCGAQVLTETACTRVTFRPCTEQELLRYIATGEPMDKAGAYGIQGRAAAFIAGIEGDYYNVVGLPLCRLGQMLGAFGLQL